MFRTRFAREIVAEFLPPAREGKKQRVIVLCDGMPSMPHKQGLAKFLAERGYWVFYPRYRGSWESDGEFLERSPHEDLLDVIDGLRREIREAAFGQRFRVNADEIFVIGGSFGGAAAILCSLDERVKKVIANCPVVDWAILGWEQRKETSNPSYAAYIRQAFGRGFRLSDRNWKKLSGGRFYSPILPCRGNNGREDHDVPREGRSLCAVPHGGEVCPAHGSEAEALSARRPLEHGDGGAEVLAGDSQIL